MFGAEKVDKEVTTERGKLYSPVRSPIICGICRRFLDQHIKTGAQTAIHITHGKGTKYVRFGFVKIQEKRRLVRRRNRSIILNLTLEK
jgi:hypothetical protein